MATLFTKLLRETAASAGFPARPTQPTARPMDAQAQRSTTPDETTNPPPNRREQTAGEGASRVSAMELKASRLRPNQPRTIRILPPAAIPTSWSLQTLLWNHYPP